MSGGANVPITTNSHTSHTIMSDTQIPSQTQSESDSSSIAFTEMESSTKLNLIGLVKLAEAAAADAATTTTSAPADPVATSTSSTSIPVTVGVSRSPAAAAAFTKQWIHQIFSAADETVRSQQTSPLAFEWSPHQLQEKRLKERKKLLRQTLYTSSPSKEMHDLIMTLQLDYEIAPGFTLLPCILDAVCRYEKQKKNSPWIYQLYDSSQLEPCDRLDVMSAILENMSLHGYTNGLIPFDWNRIWTPDMKDPGPSFASLTSQLPATHMTNIVAFILRLSPLTMVSPRERAYVEWMEKVIATILEQPSVSCSIKFKLVNHYSPAPHNQTILESVITYTETWLPICKLLLKHGADINPCALQTIAVDNIILFIEMLLNLMDFHLPSHQNHAPLPLAPIKLDRTEELFSSVPTPAFALPTNPLYDIAYLTATYYSTPNKLANRLIGRLLQWQKEQRASLASNPCFYSNEASVRVWLQQQLSLLPNQLFSSNMQCQMRELTRRLPSSDHPELMKSLIDRWIHQLTYGPEYINLVEISGPQQYRTTLFVDSMSLFFESAFRPFVPQLLGLLDNLPFVPGLALFTIEHPSSLSSLKAIANQFHLISKVVDPNERAEQGRILVQLLDVCVQRLNRILTEYQSPSDVNMGEYVQQVKAFYECGLNDSTEDAEFCNIIRHQVGNICKGLPFSLYGLFQKMCWFSTIEVFKEVWCNILPQLEPFRKFQTGYYYECLNCLVLSSYHIYYETPKPQHNLTLTGVALALDRTRTFLTDPLFQTSDLFGPFQLLPSQTSIQNKATDGLNLIFLVMRKENERKEQTKSHQMNATTPGEPKQNLLDFVIDLEAKWRTVHWPAIRINMEEYLIPDLTDLVMNYLQPSASVPRSALTAGLLSPPTQFVLQPTSKPINHVFASSTSNVAMSTPLATVAVPTNFSLSAFNWPPSTATPPVSSSSNPFIFTSTSTASIESLSTVSNPFLPPAVGSSNTNTTDSSAGPSTINPFLTHATTGTNNPGSGSVSGLPANPFGGTFISGASPASFTTGDTMQTPMFQAPPPFSFNLSSLTTPSTIIPPAERLVGVELNPGPVEFKQQDEPVTGAQSPSQPSTSVAVVTASSTGQPLMQQPHMAEETTGSRAYVDSTEVQLARSKLMQERCDWTRAWLQANYVPGQHEALRVVLFPSIAPTREESLLMKLQLDVEVLPGTGYTVLRLLLHLCTFRPITYANWIIDNLRLYGYVDQFEPFDVVGYTRSDTPPARSSRMSAVGDHPPGSVTTVSQLLNRDTNLCQINILMVILDTKRQTEVDREFSSGYAMGHAVWMERMIRAILEQPTVTKEMKQTLLNFSGRIRHDQSKQTILQWILSLTISPPEPIYRVLLDHGAEINQSSPEMDLPTPLMKVIHKDKVEFVLEMILAQKSLMTIDLTGIKYRRVVFGRVYEVSVLSLVRCTDSNEQPTDKRLFSTRIIERLYEWQEAQRQQLSVNSNHEIDESDLREWLHLELLALLMEQRGHSILLDSVIWHVTERPNDSHTRMIHLAVENLKSASQFTHFIHRATRFNSPKLLGRSLHVFLHTQFRSAHWSQLFAYLEDATIVSHMYTLFLFSTAKDDSSIFVSLAIQLKFISQRADNNQSTEMDLMARTKIILQFFAVGFKRLNQLIQLYQQGTFMNNSEYLSDLKRIHDIDPNDSSHDHELNDELLNSLKKIENDLPSLLTGIVISLGRFGTCDMFNELWLNILPSVEYFRSHELEYYSILLTSLVRSRDHEYRGKIVIKRDPPFNDRSMARFRAFLSNPSFQTSDLFHTFQFLPAHTTYIPSHVLIDPNLPIDRNLVSFTRHELLHFESISYPPEMIHHHRAFFDSVLQLESDWRTIHFPAIRHQIESHLIPDLTNIVMDYLHQLSEQSVFETVTTNDKSCPNPHSTDVTITHPFSLNAPIPISASTSATHDLSSPPAQFLLQSTSDQPNPFIISSSATAASGSIQSSTTSVVALPNFSLAAFQWPPNTTSALTDATATAAVTPASNPFIFISSAASTASTLSTSSHPFLSPGVTSPTIDCSDVINPFMARATQPISSGASSVSAPQPRLVGIELNPGPPSAAPSNLSVANSSTAGSIAADVTTTASSSINVLDRDTLASTFEFLDLCHILRIASVCQYWSRMIQTERRIWSHITYAPESDVQFHLSTRYYKLIQRLHLKMFFDHLYDQNEGVFKVVHVDCATLTQFTHLTHLTIDHVGQFGDPIDDLNCLLALFGEATGVDKRTPTPSLLSLTIKWDLPLSHVERVLSHPALGRLEELVFTMGWNCQTHSFPIEVMPPLSHLKRLRISRALGNGPRMSHSFYERIHLLPQLNDLFICDLVDLTPDTPPLPTSLTHLTIEKPISFTPMLIPFLQSVTHLQSFQFTCRLDDSINSVYWKQFIEWLIRMVSLQLIEMKTSESDSDVILRQFGSCVNQLLEQNQSSLILAGWNVERHRCDLIRLKRSFELFNQSHQRPPIDRTIVSPNHLVFTSLQSHLWSATDVCLVLTSRDIESFGNQTCAILPLLSQHELNRLICSWHSNDHKEPSLTDGDEKDIRPPSIQTFFTFLSQQSQLHDFEFSTEWTESDSTIFNRSISDSLLQCTSLHTVSLINYGESDWYGPIICDTLTRLVSLRVVHLAGDLVTLPNVQTVCRSPSLVELRCHEGGMGLNAGGSSKFTPIARYLRSRKRIRSFLAGEPILQWLTNNTSDYSYDSELDDEDDEDEDEDENEAEGDYSNEAEFDDQVDED